MEISKKIGVLLMKTYLLLMREKTSKILANGEGGCLSDDLMFDCILQSFCGSPHFYTSY